LRLLFTTQSYEVPEAAKAESVQGPWRNR
jgi:hypothetical protein